MEWMGENKYRGKIRGEAIRLRHLNIQLIRIFKKLNGFGLRLRIIPVLSGYSCSDILR